LKTLVLSGYGLNCERETVYACQQAGADQVDLRHISEIYGQGITLSDYGLIVLIGGFLDGDDLGGARACVNRFRYRELPGGGTFLKEMHQYVAEGGLAMGICNGFQLLVRLGLLPGGGDETTARQITLGVNNSGKYENRWVNLKVDPESPCIFTKGIETMFLPVRHGEGRIVARKREHVQALVDQRLVPLRYADENGEPTEVYPANPNGSPFGVASLCNDAGTVFGLMPHPEAFNHATNHPMWTRTGKNDGDGAGLILFQNAYRYLQK